MIHTLARVTLALAGSLLVHTAMAQSYGGYPYPGDDELPIMDDPMPVVMSLEGRSLDLKFASITVGALNTFAWNTPFPATGVDGAVMTVALRLSGSAKSASLSSPLVSAGALQQGGLPNRVSASGALLINLVSDDDFTTSGGSLKLSNWTVDASSGRVLVDVDGGNGIGHLDDVAFFRLGGMSVQAGDAGYATGTTNFASMVLTARGQELFIDSLGLLEPGVLVTSRLSNFGVLTVGVAMSPVPEPGGLALAMGGLLSLGWLQARRRREVV